MNEDIEDIPTIATESEVPLTKEDYALMFWEESSRKGQEMLRSSPNWTAAPTDADYLEYGRHMWEFRTQLYLEEVDQFMEGEQR